LIANVIARSSAPALTNDPDDRQPRVGVDDVSAAMPGRGDELWTAPVNQKNIVASYHVGGTQTGSREASPG
jgi:hypothetical protein